MASNALKKIITEAKKIRKRKKSISWKSAVKQASAKYRSGSIGSVKKKNRQTGSSVKHNDSMRKAKRPGKRKSASGKTYYERRKNRSDKPGSLTGVTNSTLTGELIRRTREKLGKDLVRMETATTRRGYITAKNAVIRDRQLLRKLQ